MAVQLNSFVWASAGVEPQNAEDAIYSAGDQPIAGYDNFIMWAVTEDIHNIEAYASAHAGDHEAGGSQPINLDGLDIGNAATINDASGNLTFDDGTNAFVDIDVANGLVRSFPTYDEQIDARGGLATGTDITRRDGTVIYDHSADLFHRADHANNADSALSADDAAALGGDPPSAYIQPDDTSRTITGDWTFNNTISGDIDGNAATADHATTADSATEADLAQDSNALEGEPRSTFTENAANEDISGTWGFLSGVNHVNSGMFESFAAVDTDDELRLRNGNNRFEYVPFAAGVEQTGDWFGYDFQNNYWNFGSTVYINNEEVATQTDITNVEQGQFDPSADYTITGSWTFDRLVDAKVTDAELADKASHADTADSATNADYATDAGYADDAGYSTDSDRLDGYHAQELIDMMDGGDEQWNFLDAVEYSGSTWNFDYAPTNVYDKYRLVVVNEAQDGNMNRFLLRLNGDTRHRYNYFKHNKVNGDFDLYQQENSYFPICLTFEGQTAYGEYVLTSMPTIDGGVDNYPAISRMEYAADPDASGGTLDYGWLETNYNSIDSIQIEPEDPSGAYIAIYGANFPSTTM